jgi:hypothetical protein
MKRNDRLSDKGGPDKEISQNALVQVCGSYTSPFAQRGGNISWFRIMAKRGQIGLEDVISN